MENIIGILAKVSSEWEETSSKHIAKVVMDNYINGRFLTQKELSKLTNFSEGLITIFCQKLGFEGYYEFKAKLKVEYGKYFAPVLKSETIEISTEKMKVKYDALFADILENKRFFENFTAQLSEKKRVTIFSVHSTYATSLFIASLLNSRGYDCKVFNSDENSILDARRFCQYESIFLFFLMGNDNSQLLLLLKYFKNLDGVFLITTNGQKAKTTSYKNVFVITSHYQYNNYFYRTILLETIFLTISDTLEKL